MSIRLRTTLIAAGMTAMLAACAQTGQPASTPAAASQSQVGAPAMMGTPGARMNRMQRATPEQRQAWFQQRFAREAELLKITPAQRPQWDAYVKAHEQMRDSTPMMGGNRTEWMQKMQAMTPDQRAQFHAAQMRARAAQMDNVAKATSNLRNALSAQQRTQFDQMHRMGGWKQGGMQKQPGQRMTRPMMPQPAQ